MSDPEPTVIDDIIRFAKPGETLDDTSDRRRAAAVCEMSKDFLRHKLRQFLSSAAPSAVVTRVMSSDETPLLLPRRFTKLLAGLRRIVRSGRESASFLCERTYFAHTDNLGRPCQTILVTDPTALSRGKTGWHLLACQLQAAPLPRDMGWRGPVLHHYIWDRGCFSILDRLTRKYHIACKQSNPSARATLEGLLDFTTTRADVLHDVHNAGGWGFKEYIDDDKLRSLFIGITSIRNGFADIMRFLPRWLLGIVEFRDHGFSGEVMRSLWVLLDVDEDVRDVLAQYEVLFWGGKLLVGTKWRDEPTFFDELAAALMGAWRISTFTDSRFGSLSKATKALMAAQLTGIGSLVAYALEVGRASEYYLKGYGKLASVMDTAVIIGVAGGLCDHFISLLMQDDRVMLSLDILADRLVLEQDILYDLPDAVYHILASMTSFCPAELRSRVVASALSSSTFISYKLFREATLLPWRLCDGCIQQNLEELRAGDCPEESVASQLWHLMHENYAMPALVDIVCHIRDLPWGTLGVEQQHASAALMKRMHPSMHQDLLRCRAHSHFMRALLSPAQADPRLRRLERRLVALRRKVPGRINGKCIYMRDAFDTWKKLSGSQSMPLDVKQGIVRSTGEHYAQLPASAAADFMRRAAIEADQKRIQVADEIKEVMELIREVEAESAEAASRRSRWNVKAC